MLRKKFFLIFGILLIFTFIGMNGVSAIDGLYCIYNDGNSITGAPYRMLVQDNSGSCSVYSRDRQGIIDDYIAYDTFGWKLLSDKCTNDFLIPSAVDNTNQYVGFSECPKYYNASFPYTFSDDDLSGLSYELIKKGNFNGKSNDLEIFSVADTSSYLVNKDNVSRGQWILSSESDGYTQSCLYSYESSATQLSSIQLDINFESRKVRIAGYSFTSMGFFPFSSVYTNYNFSVLEKYFNDSCPISLFAIEKGTDRDELYFSWFNDLDALDLDDGGITIFGHGNEKTLSEYNLVNSSPKIDYSKINIKDNTITIENCSDIFGDELLGLLHDGVNFVKIAVPLILIGLGIADFAKAVFGFKDEDMKKSAARFIKRVVIAIAIFFIPSFLNVILTIAHSIWGNIDPSLCGIL